MKVGEALTYSVFVGNAGPDAAEGVTLTDSLPGALEQISAESSQGACVAGPTVSCSLGTIPAGEFATVTVQARPNEERTLVNTASVTSASPDPVESNNSSTVAVQVVSDPAVISGLSVTRPVFRVPRGTGFVFQLSEPATVTFRIERRGPGRRVGGRCLGPTRRNRSRPRCVRWLRAAKPFSRPATAGPNRGRSAAFRVVR